MSGTIEVSKFFVYLLLGVITALEFVILVFQGQLWSQREEFKRLFCSRSSSPVDDRSSGTCGQDTVDNKQR